MDSSEVARQANNSASDVELSTLITLMRLYDVQMAILTHLDEDTAAVLNDWHAQGRIVGALPSFDGSADANPS